MIGRIIKRMMVYTKLDVVPANIWHRYRWSLFRRLIPSPLYFHGQQRTITRYGVRFRVFPSDLSQWVMYSDTDSRHVRAMLKYISPHSNGLILDIGANIGQFALIAANEVRNQGWPRKVLSFEPNPHVFSLLKRNFLLNKGLSKYLSIYQMALGAHDHYREMSSPRRNSGAGTMMASYEFEPHDNYMVAVKKLDRMVKSNVDFIKLDVEGFEYYVLQGARQIIQKNHPVIYMETNTMQPHQQDIFDMLELEGYKILLERGDEYFVVDRKALNEVTGVNNVVAVWDRQ